MSQEVTKTDWRLQVQNLLMSSTKSVVIISLYVSIFKFSDYLSEQLWKYCWAGLASFPELIFSCLLSMGSSQYCELGFTHQDLLSQPLGLRGVTAPANSLIYFLPGLLHLTLYFTPWTLQVLLSETFPSENLFYLFVYISFPTAKCESLEGRSYHILFILYPQCLS